ncbi:hypothetical protein D9M68_445340 [compost metagenome]
MTLENHLMKKNIILLLSLFYSGFVYSQTAYIDVKIENFPYLLIERASFFKSPKQVKVEKLGDLHFLIQIEISKPRLYNINFREILVSPGDTVSLIFRVTDPNPDHHRDTLIAKGSNTGNYTFSNRRLDRIPKVYFPDENQYRQKLPQLLNILIENYGKYTKEIETYLKEIHANSDMSAYLIRNLNWQLFYNLEYLEQKIGDYGSNKTKLYQFRDSLFSNTHFVKTDTAYSQTMETLFENQFKYMVSKKFKNVSTQQDYSALLDYIVDYPNLFIKDYFVYFLNENYAYLTKKFSDKRWTTLLLSNPYISRQRNQFLDRDNVYQ